MQILCDFLCDFLCNDAEVVILKQHVIHCVQMNNISVRSNFGTVKNRSQPPFLRLKRQASYLSGTGQDLG